MEELGLIILLPPSPVSGYNYPRDHQNVPYVAESVVGFQPPQQSEQRNQHQQAPTQSDRCCPSAVQVIVRVYSILFKKYL